MPRPPPMFRNCRRGGRRQGGEREGQEGQAAGSTPAALQLQQLPPPTASTPQVVPPGRRAGPTRLYSKRSAHCASWGHPCCTPLPRAAPSTHLEVKALIPDLLDKVNHEHGGVAEDVHLQGLKRSQGCVSVLGGTRKQERGVQPAASASPAAVGGGGLHVLELVALTGPTDAAGPRAAHAARAYSHLAPPIGSARPAPRRRPDPPW